MTADDAGTDPEPGSGPTAAVPAPRRRAAGPKRWRAWRRSRPFWGGLLLLLAGLELFVIPLSGVLVHGAIKLVIYIGIGGVFGTLIGALLVVAGLVTWFNPAHRTFYGIAGIVLGIVSFPASNLGGFFLGMLLAIIGGALAFAWSPLPAADVDARPGPGTGAMPDEAGRSEADAGLDALLAAEDSTAEDSTETLPPPGGDTPEPAPAREAEAAANAESAATS